LPGSAATLLVPAWSISVEWQYYLLAPLIALLVRSGTGLLLLAGLAWLGIRYGGPWNNPLPAFLPPMLPFFLIGIASYHLYEAFCGSGAPRSSRYAVFVAAAVGAAVVFKWHSAALAIWAVAFGCLFVAGDGTLVRVLRGLRRGLGHRWVEQLGKISYPLYLVHWPLIIICLTVLLSWKPRIASHEAALWLLCGGLPLIVGAAFLLHRFVEAPAMRLGRRLADRIGKTPSIDLLPPKEAKPGTLSLMPPGT
jgi:peptidoglycan/LPS O-acetylase OafA/YrhL